MLTLDSATLNAIFAQPTIDGRFEGQLAQVAGLLGGRRPLVLLAFAPKSAGTFFRTAIIQATGGQLARIVHAEGGRDAAPYLPTLIAYYLGAITPKPLVTHVHMPASLGNRNFLNAFDIKPVIMIRSIPDMLASLWDMVGKDPNLPMGLSFLVPTRFPSMTHEEKADLMIDMAGPWYVNYFATWMRYIQSDPDRVCVLHYHDFKSDPAAVLEKALAHARLPRSREQCQAALDSVWEERNDYRFNKGERGRGDRYFTPAHIARLERMLGHYEILAPLTDELLGRGAFAAAEAA